MKINKKQFNRWIRALRSGKYNQVTETLQNCHGFCCLGVACHVLIPESTQITDASGRLLGSVPRQQPGSPLWLKRIDLDFTLKTNLPLVSLNDGGNYNFDEIADLLEAVYIHKVLD